MLKRIITTLFCLLFIFVSIPIFGFTDFFSVSVYADDSLDGWRNATTNDEFAEAFRYYCKSRDLTLDGTVANVLTNGTTNIFNALCDGIGINVTALQGHIKYEVDSSGNKGLKWLFDSQGITFYNRLFAQFLQDNDLEVGDSVDNKVIFSGMWWEDSDGNGCFLTTTDGTSSSSIGNLISVGSPYLYTYDELQYANNNNLNVPSYTFHVFGKTYTSASRLTQSTYNGSVNYRLYLDFTKNSADSRSQLMASRHEPVTTEPRNNNAFLVVAQNKSGYMFLAKVPSDKASISNIYLLDGTDSRPTVPSGDIYIVSNIINNNTYEGDTIINNEGDVVNPPEDTPPGGQDPGWNVGGGQGSYNDGQGNNYTINFPDFELPDLNIDWSIQGLGNKFPFSIPFDIVSLITVLNAEPEAPRFQGTVNFGFTTWDYDINLQQFDTVAQVCRVAELLLLVFGLILITRSIIKG